MLDRTVPQSRTMELVDRTPRDVNGSASADAHLYDFFVSYAQVDAAWAHWIAWQLENGGLRLNGRRPRVFVRDWHVVPGMHKVSSTDIALSDAARLVAVLTPDYLRRNDPAGAEWEVAWAGDRSGHRRRVVPVRVRQCEPEGSLSLLRMVDLVGQDAAQASVTLLNGIIASIEGRAKPLVAPPFPVAGHDDDVLAAVPSFPGPPVVVGEPPTVPPKWFQDRTTDIEAIERHLSDMRTRLIMVVGEESIGKTALIRQLWEHVRTRRSLPHVHGVVYRSAHGFLQVTPDWVIDSLIDLLPRYEAAQTRATVRQTRIWVQKLAILLAALGGRQVVFAIDAVEELLNESMDIADPQLRDLVDHLVHRTGHGVRLLLVGRQDARAVMDRFPGETYRHPLDEGLPVEDGFALLRAMDDGNELDLDVPPHDRDRLHQSTGGSPRALELTYGALASQDLSFTQLLEIMSDTGRNGIVVRLLANAYERLSFEERRVLQMLAVYGRAVRATAVEHLVHSALRGLNVRSVLTRLSELRLAQFHGESFSVPATAERAYLIDRLRGDAVAGGCERPEVFLRRAAAYVAGQRVDKPHELSDLREHLMHIELTLRAGDHGEALALMGEVDDTYLRAWGSSSALMMSLKNLLDTRDVPLRVRIDALSLCARALVQQEYHREAAEKLELALRLCAGREYREKRITLWKQLAAADRHLGKPKEAARICRKTIRAAFRSRSHRYNTTARADLAMNQAKQGKFRPALRGFARARRRLARSTATEDRVDLLPILLGEAWVHSQLGQRDRARGLHQDCQRLATDLGQRSWLGRSILGEAQLALDDGALSVAVARAEAAYAIGTSNGNRWLCGVAMEVLALAQLEQGDLPAAARAAEVAQRNRTSVLGFGLVGLATYRRADADADARAAFTAGFEAARDWNQAKEPDFQQLDAYGLVAFGRALLDEPSYLTTAETAFRRARELTSERGAVTGIMMLLKQFEPRADPVLLERARAAAGGWRLLGWRTT